MLINYELLRTLVEAGSAPTFRDAAARRHVTPSAVSHQLKTLEAQIGAPLFERVGRNARLTTAGARLVAALRAEFARIDDALEAVVDDARTLRGTVTIGGPGPFSRAWLRPRLVGLMRAHPEIVFDVRFGVPSALARALAQGELDLAILVRGSDETGLDSVKIYTEEFHAVASPAYISAHGRPQTARDFRAQAFAVFDEDLAMHALWWRATFGKKEALPPKIVCRIASLDELLAIAEEGLAVTVLPSYFTADAVAQKRLMRLGPPVGRAATNAIHLAWRRGALDTARLRAVKGALQGPVRTSSA